MNVQTLRKFIASVSATALLLTTLITPGMVTSVAQAANDSSHWAYPAFEIFMDLGAANASDGTSLDTPMTRGKFVRAVLVARGDADGSETDAEIGQLAVDADVLTGDGGDTSKLNLDRTLNRAEAVAIVNRAWPDLDNYPSTGSLAGIRSGEWYEANARRAVAGAVIVGKMMNGTRDFAPGDNLTLAEGFTVILQANRAVEAWNAWVAAGNDGVPDTDEIAAYNAVDVFNFDVEIAFDTDTTDPTPPDVVAGTLTVSKVADTEKSVVADGSIVSLISLRFTNGSSQEVTVNSLEVLAKGIANDSQIDGAFLLPFTSDKRSSFADNISTVFANLRVPAGGSVDTDVALSLKGTFDSGTVGLDILSVDANITDITGLPISGKVVQVVDGKNSIGSATITALAEGNTTQRAGAEFRAGKFQITAGSNESMALQGILFDEVGSINGDEIESVRLINDQTGEELTTCDFVEGDLNCNFESNPLTLTEGVNVQVVVLVTISEKADVGADTIQFQIKRDFHVVLEGKTSGVFILPTLSPGSPVGVDVITMESGSLVLSKDSSSATGNIQPGSTNARLGSFRAEAYSETLLLTDIQVDLSTGTSVQADFSGTVRVMMHDEGQDPLAGQSLVTIDSTNVDLHDTTPTFTSANNVRMTPGTKKIITIVASIAVGATSGNTVTPNINIRYERDVSGTVLLTGVVPSNQLVMQASTVQVSGNSAFTASTEVAGTSKIKIGSITVKADNSEKLRVNTISLNLSSITGLTNLALYRADQPNSPQYGTSRGTLALTGNTFSSNTPSVSEVAVGATAIFDVFADSQTNATNVFVTVPANGVTFTGVVSSNTRTLPAANAVLPLVTIVAGEQLRVTTVTQPTKGAVSAGQTGVLVGRVKLEARFGPVVIQEFRFRAFQGTGNFQNFTLKKSDATTLLSGVSIINGNVNFPLTLTLEKNVEMTLEVFADATASGVLVSQQNFSLALAGVEYDGGGSGTSGVPATSQAEVLTSVTSTSAELALQANETLLVSDTGAAGVPDPVRLATAFFDYEANYTASPVLNGATASITAGTQISTFPYNNADQNANKLVITASTTSTNLPNEDFALGDLVYVYDASTPANTGIAVVTVALANAVNGSMLTVWVEGTAAPVVVTLATGDVVLRLATSVTDGITVDADDFDGVEAGEAGPVVQGQVAFFGDASTAGNSGLTVITDSQAADGSAAGAVINGVTVADGDVIAVYSSLQNEIPSTSAAFSYNSGSLVVVADSAMPANSGLFLANTTLLPGQDLTTAGALITGKTLVAGATGDRIAVLNGLVISGEPKQVQDSFPTISLVPMSNGLITAAEQLVAKLKIQNTGTRELVIIAFKFKCTGSWVDANVQDNVLRVERNGATTLSITRSDAGALNCTTTPLVTLNSPETITPGGTLELWMYFDTSGSAAGTNKFFSLEFTQTAGVVGSCVARFSYTQGSGGTGTNPTNGSPAQICNGNTLYGSSFES